MAPCEVPVRFKPYLAVLTVIILMGALVLTRLAYAHPTTKEPNEYRTIRLSPREVVITCKGEDVVPQVHVLKDYFIVVTCPHP